MGALLRRHRGGQAIPRIEIGDLSGIWSRLSLVGSVLGVEEFLDLLPLLQAAGPVHDALVDAAGTYGCLETLRDRLTPLPHLERSLVKVFAPDGSVLDDASPALRRIRRERERRREAVRTRMERWAAKLGGGDTSGLVTLREGRYVVAVPQGRKSEVRGVILDRSGSGATFYVEPLDTVEENNALRELEVEEREEIRRILAELSDRMREELPALRGNDETLGEIDALRAKVQLAARWRAETVELDETPGVRLRGMRHPLLLEGRLQEAGGDGAWDRVVPLDVDLGGATRLLLLTGPNMGGKTVALKSIGLASLLTQCGCAIPAGPGTRVGWVDRWVVSLGDEQDLERDLSTFAAHLQRWGDALQAAGPRTLVLLDELGSGTDPTEGAALAQSVLEGLVEKGAMGLVTTHLGTLKGFAADTEGVANGSMIFDAAGAGPTYRLEPGVPGESHALEMARRLGFPAERVERAEALMPESERDLRRLLADLNLERGRLHTLREDLEKRVAEADRLGEERRRKLEKLLAERSKVRASSARRARGLLRRAEETLRAAERQSRQNQPGAGPRRQDLVREQERLARLEAVRPQGGIERARPESIRAGERYWAEPLGREVEVVREPDASGRVLVIQRGVRVELPREALRVAGGSGPGSASPAAETAAPPVPVAMSGTDDTVSPELNLIGLRVDEALPRLERALDRALLAGLTELRVVHGKGTGALKAAVAEHCRGHAAVSGIREGGLREGGGGVTVVELEG